MAALKRTAAVTGAFSYSGAYIAQALLEAGWEVRTLTRRPDRPHPLQSKIAAFPLDFNDPAQITRQLEGVDTLVNTYWVRFDHGASSFAGAIENSRRLFQASETAGVRRLIHLSVSNPDLNSSLPYYAGKARVEEIIRASRLSYAVLRPTLIFGEEELLVNNIAWLLRKLPLFVIPGDGRYRLQPISVRDLAQVVVRQAAKTENTVIDAGGPEVLEYRQLIALLHRLVGSRARILHAPPGLAIIFARLLSLFLRDVLLTRDELDGLMQERLLIEGDGLPGTAFSAWARENAHLLGRRYTNELQRHHQDSL